MSNHVENNVTKENGENPSKECGHFKAEYKKIYNDVLEVVGCTPIVKLNAIPKEEKLDCDIYTKLEFLNPGGSVKDRIAVRMLQKAEQEGVLVRGKSVVIEPTSGNTGIGLAFACAVRGYRCIIVLPEKMSNEKVDTLQVLGAEVLKTPSEAASEDPESNISVAHRLSKEIPNAVILNQYQNKNNPLAHYENTAEEILWSMDGKLDMVVFGVGTGGTATGIAKKIKERCPDCITVGIDPYGSILAQPETLNKSNVTFYEVEGIGYDFIPNVLDRSYIDEWVKVDDKDSLIMARRLMKDEGILGGASSGSAVWGAIQAARRRHLKAGQKCVVILPDGMRNYMTKFVSDQWMEARQFKELPNPDQAVSWWNVEVSPKLYKAISSVVLEQTSTRDALKKLDESKLPALAVVDQNNSMVGVFSAENVRKRLANFPGATVDDPFSRYVEKKKYYSIDLKGRPTLGQVSRILDIASYVVVLNSQNTHRNPVGIITTEDLLPIVTKELSC